MSLLSFVAVMAMAARVHGGAPGSDVRSVTLQPLSTGPFGSSLQSVQGGYDEAPLLVGHALPFLASLRGFMYDSL